MAPKDDEVDVSRRDLGGLLGAAGLPALASEAAAAGAGLANAIMKSCR